jgi:hypothetical protein
MAPLLRQSSLSQKLPHTLWFMMWWLFMMLELAVVVVCAPANYVNSCLTAR